MIALDPGAPDGWSEPFETVPLHQLVDDPPPPVPAVAPGDPGPRRSTLRHDQMPLVEPKVQIDPTLIQPVPTLPADDPFAATRPSSPDMPIYGGPDGRFPPTPTPAPMAMPMPNRMPTPTPMPMPMPPAPMAMPMPIRPTPPQFGPPHGPPAYPMDPGYQMVPIATLPRAVSSGGSDSGFIDPRYASDTALPVQPGRRRVIIVLASAIVAVVIGIVVLAAFTGKHDAPTPTDVDPAAPSEPSRPPAVPADPPPGPPAPAAIAPGEPAAPSTVAAIATPPPEATTCYADVSSVPAGAEIVVGEDVVGTTPQRVALPCGNKVELTIRKGRLVAATRSVTPTPDGARLRVALGKQLFQVKVSSTPAGATITLNGKALGVTPTTVKVPAFEASTLNITKDGFAPDTEKVAPRSNGTAVHATLKKLDRRPR